MDHIYYLSIWIESYISNTFIVIKDTFKYTFPDLTLR